MKLLTAAALTAVVLSQESIMPISAEIPVDEPVPTDSIMVATAGTQAAHFLQYLDVSVGAVAGFYVPFTKWARNDDCFSNFIGVADSIVGYHVPFDGDGLPSTPVNQILFGANAALVLLGVYGTYTSCVN